MTRITANRLNQRRVICSCPAFKPRPRFHST